MKVSGSTGPSRPSSAAPRPAQALAARWAGSSFAYIRPFVVARALGRCGDGADRGNHQNQSPPGFGRTGLRGPPAPFSTFSVVAGFRGGRGTCCGGWRARPGVRLRRSAVRRRSRARFIRGRGDPCVRRRQGRRAVHRALSGPGGRQPLGKSAWPSTSARRSIAATGTSSSPTLAPSPSCRAKPRRSRVRPRGRRPGPGEPRPGGAPARRRRDRPLPRTPSEVRCPRGRRRRP